MRSWMMVKKKIFNGRKQIMKKRVISLMTLVATVAALASCSKKEEEAPIVDGAYQYRFELAEDGTRATLNDNGVFWKVGEDHVGLFVGSGVNARQADIEEVDEKKMVKLVSDDPLEGKTAYAFYPYYKNMEGAASASLYINPLQMGGAVSAMPMVGIPYEIQSGDNNGRIYFMNMGSIIDFRVYSSNETYQNETVRYITYQATNDNAAVAGLAKVDLTGVTEETPGTLNWTAEEGADPEKEVTLTLMETVYVAAKKDDATTPQYMVLAPGTYSGKITVVTNAAAYEFSFENKELKRNRIHKYTMDLGGNNATRKSVYYKAESMVDGKKYLIISNGRSLQNASSSTLSVVSVEESIKDDGTIIYDAPNAALWEASSGALKNISTERYLSYSSNSLRTSSSSSTCTYANYTLKVGTRYIYYTSGSSFSTSSNTPQTTFLYTTDAPTSWIMSYDATEAVYDMNEALAEHWDPYCPKLTCEDGANVTYESSKTSVATVDENGNVTALKRGSTTITATATGDGHSETTASYTLKVIDSSIPPSVYTKVTAVDDLEPDAQYLIVFEGLEGDEDGDGDPKVFEAIVDGSELAKDAGHDVTINNDVITSNLFDEFTFTLEEGYYLKADNVNKYMYPMQKSGTGGAFGTEDSASKKLTITIDSNGIASILNDSRYVVWSTNSHYFSVNSSISGTSSTGICLYKLDDGRQIPTMSFDPATAEIDIAYVESFTKPELTYTGDADASSIAYTSSDAAIAEVSSDGTITPHKKGTVTITAKAPRTATYKAASASYELTVKNSNIQSVTYYKASMMEDGNDYIIVSAGQALKNNGSGNVVASVAVTVTNNTITLDDVDGLLWTATEVDPTAIDESGDPQGLFNYGTHSLKNGSDNLWRHSNNGSYTVESSNSSLTRYMIWNYDGTYFWNHSIYQGTQHSDYWVYYSSGWQSSKTQTETSLYTSRKPYTGDTPSFASTTASLDLANKDQFIAPQLNNIPSGWEVAYQSSDEDIVTVDNNGAITPKESAKSGDNVTISAIVSDPNKEYQGAKAEYTLNITNSNVPTYYKVDGLENGEKYIIVSNGYALVLNGTSVTSASVSTTDTAGEVKYDAPTSALWTANVSGTTVKVKNENNYLRHSGSSASFSISSTDSRNVIVYDAENNTVKVGNYYLNFNGTSFVLSSSSNGTSAAFFSATKPLPSLSFDKASVIYDLANNDWTSAMPVLSPANADVTYSFVNNNNANIISSIDANGAVTLVASPTKGTATVTAAAKTPSDYKVASASYTVQVINSNEIPTYTKVDEIISGGTYLIVSHLDNLAFEGDAETPTGASKSVTPNNGIITASSYMEYEAYEVVIKEESSEHYSIYFTKLKRYLALNSSTDSGLSSSDSWASGSTSTDFTMSKVASGDYSGSFLFAARSSSSRVLYHNGTQFKLGGSGTSKGVHLYKKN